MLPTRTQFLTFLLAIVGSLPVPASAGELVLAGPHPTSPSTAYPAIHVLKAFEGRIYMGYGDWNRSPAVAIVSYDPATAAFTTEHSFGSDSIGSFRVLGDELFVPAIDPVHFDEFIDFSVRSGGVWRRFAPAGFLHVFDAATLDGTDRWFVGAKTANETPGASAAVWRSVDGVSWTDATLATSVARYYYAFTLRGKLYVHDTVYDGATATRIGPFPYEQLYRPLNLVFGSNEIIVACAQSLPGLGSFSRQSLVSFDGTNWQVLKGNVVDVAVAGPRVYTLDYNPASGSNELQVANVENGLPLAWSVLPMSNVATNAKAIEVLGESIYVGDTDGRLWAGKLDGSVTPLRRPATLVEAPDGFGRAIAVDATTLAIGAPEFSSNVVMFGRVTVWTRATNGATWANPQVIPAPQPVFSAWFGKDVTVENDVLAVLEAGIDPSRADRGAAARVHLYERAGGVWQPRQILTNGFAHALALCSNTLWVATSTQLHRYAITNGTNGITATLVETVGSGAPAAMYEPVARVAAGGDRVAYASAGDFSRAGGPGQVAVFERSGTAWNRVATLVQNSPPLPPGLTYQPDAFGFAVALAGDWLAVGAPRDDTAASQAGAVHLYQRTFDGTNVSYVARQKIISPMAQAEAGFGSSLAFDGQHLVVGCSGAHTPANQRAGRAYVFRLEGTNTVFVDHIVAPPASQTEFGTEVALDGATVVIGSRATATNAEPLNRIVFRDLGALAGARADIALFGSVDPVQAVAGVPVQHTLIVSNAGPSNATSIVVAYRKPARGSITGFSSSDGTCSNDGTTVRCVFPALPAGASASLRVTAEPGFASACEIMRSYATADAQEFDGAVQNNTVELRVNDLPPTIGITSPADGTVVRFGATVELRVIAASSNGVVEVSFYTNGAPFGSVASAPFALTWSNVPPGSFTLSARVTDGCGIVRTSAPVVLVVASNEPPSVAIIAPLDRTRFSETNGIRIQVAATDADGTVEHVDLLEGTNLLQRFTAPPYVFTWNSVPLGARILRAVAVDNDGATKTSSPVLIVIGDEPSVPGWFAYNDHGPGTGTHTNATRWDIRGLPPGASGPLKDIATGLDLPVTVAITRTNASEASTSAAPPDAGTPAAMVFGPYVDWLGGGSFPNVRVGSNQFATYTFSGLDPAHAYRLQMTAVHGTFQLRWTRLSLRGATRFRNAHTAGALTQGTGDLGANEAALNTGLNRSGDMAGWEEITPAADGTLHVVATQYSGPVPGGSSMGNGYVPTVLRLEDTGVVPLPLIATSTVSQTVSPGATPSFAVTASGTGTLVYQWLHDDVSIAGATSAVLHLPPVQTADAGRYVVRVSDSNGHALSRAAVLTLLSIDVNRELEISGPTGQLYRIEARAGLEATNTWMVVTNLILPSTPLRFREAFGTNATRRFYRTIAVP